MIKKIQTLYFDIGFTKYIFMLVDTKMQMTRRLRMQNSKTPNIYIYKNRLHFCTAER